MRADQLRFVLVAGLVAGCSFDVASGTSALNEVCRPASDGEAWDQTCDPSVAQPTGFLCLDDGDGAGVCRPACDLGASTEPCPDQGVCLPADHPLVGFCRETCELFGDGPACSGANICQPLGLPERNDEGQLMGTCAPNVEGGGGPGNGCTPDAPCADGLLCVGGTCRHLCEPDDRRGACPALDEVCVGPGGDAATSDSGSPSDDSAPGAGTAGWSYCLPCPSDACPATPAND